MTELPIRSPASQSDPSIQPDSQSSLSATVSRYQESINKKREWNSNWHFIISTLCYCTSTYTCSSFVKPDNGEYTNIVQYIICYLFFGMPMMYMQIVLGQYTQMGMFYFKYCVPLARGISHAYLLCVLLDTVRSGFTMTDKLMYFLLAFQSVLPWSECSDEYKDKCIANKTTGNYNNTYHSAYLYWRYIYMNNPTLTLEDINEYKMPSLPRIVSLLVIWVLTFGVISVYYSTHQKIIRVFFYTYGVGLILMFLFLIFRQGSTNGLSTLLKINVGEFFKIQCWMKAIKTTITELTLAELYHMYAGAHLAPNAQSGAITVGCVFCIIAINILASGMTNMCDGLTKFHTGQDSIARAYNLSLDTISFFVVIPQGLTYISFSQMWCTIYFGTNMLLAIGNQTLHLISMQMAITDMYPNFYKFRLYLLGVICICSAFSGLCLIPDCIYALNQTLSQDALCSLKSLCVLILSLSVFWIYGVTNLSDDIHFMLGSQPTKFWKICWYLCPVFMIIQIAHITIQALSRPNVYIFITIGSSLAFSSPIVIFFVVEILSYIKKRKLLGVIRPTEIWGPPDPDELRLRRMFHPRFETRFDAQRLTCEHSCVFANKSLKSICKEENTTRREHLETKN